MEKYKEFKTYKSIIMVLEFKQTDFTFTLIDEKHQARYYIKCHKIKLAECGNFLRFLLSSRKCNSLGYFFKATDKLDVDAIRLMLQEGYQIEAIESMEEAVKLYCISSRFDYKTGMTSATAYVKSNLTPKNVWVILELSETDSSCLEALVETALKFVQEETTLCLQSVDVKICSQWNLCKITSSGNLKLEKGEKELIRAVVTWTEFRVKKMSPKTSRKVLRQCLSHLRFLTLTPQEFCEEVQMKNLLNPEDIATIYLHIIKPDTKDPPLPSGFSNIRTARAQGIDHSAVISKDQTENGKLRTVSCRTSSTNVNSHLPEKEQSLVVAAAPYTAFLIEGPCSILAELEVLKRVEITAVLVNSQIRRAGSSQVSYLEIADASIHREDLMHDDGEDSWGNITEDTGFGKIFSVPMIITEILEPKTKYILKIELKQQGLYPCKSSSLIVNGDSGGAVIHVKCNSPHPVEGMCVKQA